MGADIQNSVPHRRQAVSPRKRAPAAKPPFTLRDLKAAIPPHCFQRHLFRSLSYLAADLIGITALYFLASTFIPALPRPLQWLAWPSYWFTQSCVTMGLWNLGHECGHHAFSNYQWLDDTVGFVIHSCLSVPYFSWKFSHASHHAHTASLERDENYIPGEKPLSVWKYINNPFGRVAYILGSLTFGLYLYLAINASGRRYERFASHYDPYSPIFSPRKRLFIVWSNLGLLAVALMVYHVASVKGALWVVAVYGVPLLLTNAWLVTITILQHTHPSLPHYDSSVWDWLRGALSTVDRDYGVLNHVFNHLPDTHVLHHLFPRIPHYHAMEATNAIKPILGEYYQFDGTAIPQAFYQMMKECVFVKKDEKKGVYWYRSLADESLS